jgi:aspartate racemase
MKTLGLIGGMSWESTIPYYRIINETVRERVGGFHSASLLLYSMDFDAIESAQREGRWDDGANLLRGAARTLETAGAQLLLLCTNTMHRVADQVQQAVRIPLLHIVDPTAERIRASGLRRVGLLGTRYTMEQPFFVDRCRERHALDVFVPPAADRELVNRIIFEELVMGRFLDASRTAYRGVMQRLVDDGAEAVIYGCTEIGLLVGAADAPVPVFDTTQLHAETAALWAIGATGS